MSLGLAGDQVLIEPNHLSLSLYISRYYIINIHTHTHHKRLCRLKDTGNTVERLAFRADLKSKNKLILRRQDMFARQLQVGRQRLF